MDIINHAITGAAIGASVELSPRSVLIGTLTGIAPDVSDFPLFYKRREIPTDLYAISHSFEVFLGMLAAGLIFDGFFVVSMAWCAHILLDYITHGETWGPKFIILKIPVPKRFEEWEFFNWSWWRGLGTNFVFCGVILWI